MYNTNNLGLFLGFDYTATKRVVVLQGQQIVKSHRISANS